MKYCVYCGKMLPDDARYCSQCGKENASNLSMDSRELSRANGIKCPSDSEVQSVLSRQNSFNQVFVLEKAIYVVMFGSLILAVYCALKTYSLSLLFGQFGKGYKPSSSYINQILSPIATAEVWSILFYILGLALFFSWIYKSYKNLIVLYCVHNVRFSPGWAIGWFFIPFMNIYKPFQVLNELWSKSFYDEGFLKQNGRLIIAFYWLVFIINSILARWSQSNFDKLDSKAWMPYLTIAQKYEYAFQLAAVADLTMILTISGLMFIIYNITRQQRKQYNCELTADTHETNIPN